MLLLCLAVILLCTLAGLLGGQLPDFSKPLLVRGQREGGGPQAWPPQLSLGQTVGVAQLGMGWQWWALNLQRQSGRWYRGDTFIQPSRQAGWLSLLQGLKGPCQEGPAGEGLPCLPDLLGPPPCRALSLGTQTSGASSWSGEHCRPSRAPGNCFPFPQTWSSIGNKFSSFHCWGDGGKNEVSREGPAGDLLKGGSEGLAGAPWGVASGLL